MIGALMFCVVMIYFALWHDESQISKLRKSNIELRKRIEKLEAGAQPAAKSDPVYLPWNDYPAGPSYPLDGFVTKPDGKIR